MNRIPSNYFRSIEFTLQTGCPVGCNFCPQLLFLKGYTSPEKKFTIDSFRQALSNLQNSTIKTVQFSGFSEPLHHEDISDFIKLSVEAGFEVEIFTTLKGFNAECLKKVEDLPIKWYISMQPLGIQNRKGLKDEEAWNNIKSFLDLNLKFQPILRCVDFNLSKGQKNQLNEKVKQIGIENIIYSNFETRAGNITRNSINKIEKKLLCKNNMAPVILPNGDVLLCCMDFGLKHIIGNIFKESFKNILLSDRLHKIIDIMDLREKGSILCQTCESAIPVPFFVSIVNYAKAKKIINLITNSILPSGSKRKEKAKTIFKKFGLYR